MHPDVIFEEMMAAFRDHQKKFGGSSFPNGTLDASGEIVALGMVVELEKVRFANRSLRLSGQKTAITDAMKQHVATKLADAADNVCKSAISVEKLTWSQILIAVMFDTLSVHEDELTLRSKLVNLGSMVASWVADIDRKLPPVQPGLFDLRPKAGPAKHERTPEDD